MLYRILADMVVLLHFLWILFLMLGAIWGRRRRAVKFLHLGGLLFAVIIQIFGWYCPLTHIEVWLRQRHDPTVSYGGSFIVHYAEKLIYIELTRTAVFILTLCLITVNLLLYFKKKHTKTLFDL